MIYFEEKKNAGRLPKKKTQTLEPKDPNHDRFSLAIATAMSMSTLYHSRQINIYHLPHLAN